jgi:hypothetical protein
MDHVKDVSFNEMTQGHGIHMGTNCPGTLPSDEASAFNPYRGCEIRIQE